VERVWNAHVPTAPGRDLTGILTAATDEAAPLGGLLVGGVDLADLPDSALAEAALAAAGFVVSLEIRRSSVTPYADVVLPVAVAAEKAGRFVTWEGRRRPFNLTLTNTGQLPDGRVLNALADELDIDLGLNSHEDARAELDALGAATVRVNAPRAGWYAHGAHSVQTSGSQTVLATWHELIDGGSLTDGEENLAGTAKPLRVVLGVQTAAGLGVADGDAVTVSTPHGSITAAVQVTERAAPGVVWLPANHRRGSVRKLLNAVHGDPVTVVAALTGNPSSDLGVARGGAA
jgi:NADH-quinone oxidoreductase subunit G